MGSSSGSATYTFRYATYVETAHKTFLATEASAITDALEDNPYDGLSSVEVDNGFFGEGYTIESFPAMYDMFGKFLGGLDIDALWEETQTSVQSSGNTSDLVKAQSAILQDELESSSLTELAVGMRDLNAVSSSTYIVGKAILQDSKSKQVNKFAENLYNQNVSLAQERWKAELEWNKTVQGVYMAGMELYFNVKDSIGRYEMERRAKTGLWPLDVLDYERAALGALQNAAKQTSSSSSMGTNRTMSVASGVLGGAATGASVSGGNGYATAAGAVIGGVVALLSS